MGQLSVRLALLALEGHDRAAAIDRLSEAARCWKAAGAIEPAAALLEELRGLAARRRAGPWEEAAETAVAIAEAAAAPKPVADRTLAAEVAELRLELAVVPTGAAGSAAR
jgi:hypothetical protein